ncbi:hypothetical protein B0T10DRAFT_500781 [Thelonectria olida]|uniref:ORC1/DEAH AAA+ ATPase domain-containing protein n=1 Tax=Thelonectria olida TaxID=1576542 RepID=A0A9P8VPL5_9HYPO|nr:hypothetical protein B0T10DRAFT_500781 [Thelonectria olida]
MSGASFHGLTHGHNIPAGINISGGTFDASFNGIPTSRLLPRPRVCRVIPYPRTEDGVHRSDLVAKLDVLLPSTPDYRSAALWGLGGSGKTQIALEYAYRRCTDPTCSVFWVHADTETTFTQDYKTIAKKLGLDDALNGEDLLAAVREHLESQPQWLLVLDNADQLGLFGVGLAAETTKNLHNYIPRGPTGTVLWTSRDERIVGTLVGPRRGIEVSRMAFDEAMTLLETAIHRSTDDDEQQDASALLEELQRLPLAICQAGVYIRRTLLPIREYLAKLAEEKDRWRILKETEMDRHRRPDVPNSVLETWSISVARMRHESELAYRLIHVLAYIDNQSIPFEIVAAASTKFGKESIGCGNEATNAVTRLKEFSFVGIRRTESSQSYEMHKLVQEAIRYGLRYRRERADGAYFSKIASQIVIELFPKRNREAWADCEKYLTHAVRVSDWAEICGKEVEISNLLSRVSNYLYDRGRWREKGQVDARALRLRLGVLGEKHQDTIWSMGELATTYYQQGRYDEAEEIYVKVLELRREVLGEKHPDTIWSIGELATTYYQQSRYDKAEEIYVKVLELRREVLGEKHPHTIQSLGSLATTYHAQGRYDTAEGIYVKVLELQREVLGEKHPDKVWSMGELAATYHQQGRYDEAEEIKVKVLELRQEVLGEKHPHTIQSMGSLAATYHQQGRYDKAEGIYVKVLELRREVLGGKHPHTIQSMRYLATTYGAQGRYDEAEDMKAKVLELRREVLGEKHPDTIESMGSLAVTYHQQGRYDKAEAIKAKESEIRGEVLGEKHPHAIQSMAELAATYGAQGRYDEAEDLKVKVLELRREVLGEKHPHILRAMHDLAVTWRSQNRSDDAVGLMEECWQLRCAALGPEHPSTKSSAKILGRWKQRPF